MGTPNLLFDTPGVTVSPMYMPADTFFEVNRENDANLDSYTIHRYYIYIYGPKYMRLLLPSVLLWDISRANITSMITTPVILRMTFISITINYNSK